MSADYLTTREFDRWRGDHDKKIDRILAAVETNSDGLAEHETRIALIEDRSGRTAKISGGVSAIVSGIVAGLVTAFSGKAQ
jgi:hypothetical protein